MVLTLPRALFPCYIVFSRLLYFTTGLDEGLRDLHVVHKPAISLAKLHRL